MIVFFYRKVQLELRNLNLHLSTKFSIRESFKRQLLKHSPYSRISAQSTGVSFTGNQPSLFSFLESTPTENNFQCILCIDVFSRVPWHSLCTWFNMTATFPFLSFHLPNSSTWKIYIYFFHGKYF